MPAGAPFSGLQQGGMHDLAPQSSLQRAAESTNAACSWQNGRRLTCTRREDLVHGVSGKLEGLSIAACAQLGTWAAFFGQFDRLDDGRARARPKILGRYP